MTDEGDDETMSDNVTDERLIDGSGLCTSCGLCCQGILEKAAVLESVEVELAKELNLKPFVTDEGIHKFHLPCPLIQGNVCSVYNGPHPNVCKEFQCVLLDQLLSGEMSLEASLKIILKIKKYINLINEKVSFIDSSKSFLALIQDCWDLQQCLNEELLFDISACRYLVFRYIMSPSKPYSIDKLFLSPCSYKKGIE
jgi:Fe-S-cluster containining protein